VENQAIIEELSELKSVFENKYEEAKVLIAEYEEMI
jgi:hypothetical protein